MKKNIFLRLALLALAVSIVLPVYSSVKNLSSYRAASPSPLLLAHLSRLPFRVAWRPNL